MAKAVRDRARSSVLTAGLTLAALTAGLAVWSHVRPDLRDPPYYAKQRILAEQYDRPAPGRLTVVALGSSRTGNGFHPPTAAAEVTAATGRPCLAFNTAMPGSGPISQLLQLRRLLAAGIRPDLVVVEVTPVMCVKPETNFLRPDRVSRAELDVLTEIGFADAEYRADWWEATLNPWFGLRFQLLGHVRSRWTPPGVPKMSRRRPDPTGWNAWREDRTAPDVHQARQAAVARGEHFHALQTLSAVGEVPGRALAEVFATCRREGITAVAVLPPEGSDFRSWYGPGAGRVAAELLETALAATAGRAVDARGWIPDDGFVDGHHMRARAAPVYTARLTRELIVPALGGAAPCPGGSEQAAGPGRGPSGRQVGDQLAGDRLRVPVPAQVAGQPDPPLQGPPDR